MADQLEEWLARRFSVLEDVDVPDLWERIVGHADTEPVADLLAPRRRRWLPLAAAALLVVVSIGVYAFAADPETAEPSSDVMSPGTTPSRSSRARPAKPRDAHGDRGNRDVRHHQPDRRQPVGGDPPNAAGDDLGRCARELDQFVRTGTSDVIAVDDPPVSVSSTVPMTGSRRRCRLPRVTTPCS